MTTYSTKAVEWAEPPEVKDRVVKAVIGRVDTVDNDREIIIGDSFTIKQIRASSWLHNSMTFAKHAGMVNEVMPPVGYGNGRRDGDLIIGEVEVVKTAQGDAFLEHVRTAGSALGYSHGFSLKQRKTRPDGVVELHGVHTIEMSPVPEPATPGTGTLKQEMGAKLDLSVLGKSFAEIIDKAVQDYVNSSEFPGQVQELARAAMSNMVFDEVYAATKKRADAALNDLGSPDEGGKSAQLRDVYGSKAYLQGLSLRLA